MRKKIVMFLPWMLFFFVAAGSGTMICRNYLWDGGTWIKQVGTDAGSSLVTAVNSGGSEVLDVFASATTVVDKEFSDPVLYGTVTSDVWQQAVQDGRTFRARSTFTLNSGETRFFYATSPSDDYEVQLRVDASSTAETEYSVWLEPVVAGGTGLRSGSLNPHVQAIGGWESQYSGVTYNPTSITSLGIRINDATERWGQGGKTGGTSVDKPATILSPVQVLGFQFCSFFNGNIIHAEWIWKETPGGIEE